MLVVPSTIRQHRYVHLHRVFSSLSDVDAGDNCLPLPLVASVAALVLLHWVRDLGLVLRL